MTRSYSRLPRRLQGVPALGCVDVLGTCPPEARSSELFFSVDAARWRMDHPAVSVTLPTPTSRLITFSQEVAR